MQSNRSHAFYRSDIGFTTNFKYKDDKIPKMAQKRLNPKRRKKEKEKARLKKLQQYSSYLRDECFNMASNVGKLVSSNDSEEMDTHETNHKLNSDIYGTQSRAVFSTEMEKASPGDVHKAAIIVHELADNNCKMNVDDLKVNVNIPPISLGFEDKENFIKFLKGFDHVFNIQQSQDPTKSEEILLVANLEICLPYTSGKCEGDCNDLHVCKFHALSACEIWNCKFGHSFDSPHNQRVLLSHLMQYLQPAQVNSLLRTMSNRRGVTIPGICRFYNRILGCRNAETCPYLHVCLHIAETCRYYPFCKFSHNLLDRQPRMILQKYGIDMSQVKKEEVFDVLLRSSFVDSRNSNLNRVRKDITAEHPKCTDLPKTNLPIFSWRSKDDGIIPENWNEFTKEENDIIQQNFKKYKAAYEKFLKFKEISVSFGSKQLMVDFYKMEGTVECGSTRQEIMLNKKDLSDLEEGTNGKPNQSE